MSNLDWPAPAQLIVGAFAFIASFGVAGAEHKSGHEHAEERVALVDVLEVAVRRSPDMTIARADRAEGRDRVAAADAVDAWHLLGRAYGQDVVFPRAFAGPGTALDTRSIAAELGVSRSLSTGGDIAVAVASSQVTYSYPNLTNNSQVAPTGSYVVGGTISSLRMTASQPLLRQRGEDAARADQKLEKLAGRSVSANADDEAAAFVRDLVVAYWELAYANAQLDVDREGEALAVRQVAITQDVVRTGMQSPSAAKLAELQVALRREAVLRDESALLEHSLTVRRLAGYEMTTTLLVPSDDMQVPSEDRPEADVVAATLARGPGIAQKRLAQRGADVTVDATSNAALPRVDLSLSGELSGIGTSVGDAFGHIGDGQMYTVMGGVTMQWDLGGAAGAAAAKAEMHRARLEGERAGIDRELQASAMSASRELISSRQRVELSQVAVDVAVEMLRTETVAFQAGRSTNVLVFQRQDDVAVAKLRLARARIDAIESDVLIDYLTGTLLTRFGIKVAEPRSHS